MKPSGNKKAVSKVAPREITSENAARQSEMAELQALVEFLKKHEVAEFDLDRGDFKVRLKFTQPEPAYSASPNLAELARLLAPTVAPVPVLNAAATAVPVAAMPAAPVAVDADAGLHIVKSPIVGTFYESPSPGASAFVEVGDKVQKGQVICIVEAMKLMNEIESDATGEIVKRLVSNGQAIEFGQPLYTIRQG